jgi:hypothetical protein
VGDFTMYKIAKAATAHTAYFFAGKTASRSALTH